MTVPLQLHGAAALPPNTVGGAARFPSAAKQAEKPMPHAPARPDGATGPLADQLRVLFATLVASHTDSRQRVDLRINVSAGLSTSRRDAVITRIVHELMANALMHGMHMRLLGQVSIRIEDQAGGGMLIDVSNNGWKLARQLEFGKGLKRVAALVVEEGGSLHIDDQPQTCFQIVLRARRHLK